VEPVPETSLLEPRGGEAGDEEEDEDDDNDYEDAQVTTCNDNYNEK
jgi:hypothetical protein